jgi:anti-sigma regulatory factor (Ser/Thr protein kinase)
MSLRRWELLRCRVPCDASAPGLVRRALAGLDAIKPVRSEALLVASELVTNAVLHSGCEPTEEVEVVAEAIPGSLRIIVTDPGRSNSAPTLATRPPGPGSFGLRVVEAVARRWGAERCEGLRVWAELAL